MPWQWIRYEDASFGYSFILVILKGQLEKPFKQSDNSYEYAYQGDFQEVGLRIDFRFSRYGYKSNVLVFTHPVSPCCCCGVVLRDDTLEVNSVAHVSPV